MREFLVLEFQNIEAIFEKELSPELKELQYKILVITTVYGLRSFLKRVPTVLAFSSAGQQIICLVLDKLLRKERSRLHKYFIG